MTQDPHTETYVRKSKRESLNKLNNRKGMAKKFKHKEGESVKFEYYDGSVHRGVIVKAQYRNEDVNFLETQYEMPTYTVHCPDSSGRYARGYMSYPCVTENMIRVLLDDQIVIKPLEGYRSKEVTLVTSSASTTGKPITNNDTSELDEAISQQRKFLNK
jgi:hypothetical protein